MSGAAAAQGALDDRYTADHGRALMSGIQALVRMLIEQRRLDAGRGLDTGVYVSGYPGSPLGGLDRELARAGEHLTPRGVVFQPAVNEELAATAINGTQLIEQLPGRTRDGVVGIWYGKAPGLDRAADAIRHGNISGTSHLGGAVALVGDDPTCKSSTLPSSCELMAESLMMPLLSPGSVQEIVGVGLHAVALSREAGLWTAIKVVSDVADAAVAVTLDDLAAGIPKPPPGSRGAPPMLLGASSVAAEHDLMGARLGAAREYGRRHRLNRIMFEPSAPRRALVAPGPAFATLQRALTLLGIGEPELEAMGIRLVQLALVWPLHPADARAFADGVQEILVVEDKRPFVERQLRDLLYGVPGAPPVLGKRDEDGRSLIELAGMVDADQVADALARHWNLGDRTPASASPAGAALPLTRAPFFCSGCPHNLSTRAPDDQLVGAGIGCHALVLVDTSRQRGHLLGSPQMGGEGAQWNGMAPFTSERHYVQNIGDGTFHHSGSLAIRAAVAAGVNITFRLLYNDAIAMTGGQAAPGRLDPVTLTHWLASEGVRRVIVTTEDPGALAGERLAAIATVRHRDGLTEALAELSRADGVTVLLHTDRCATEERRLRKRGKLPTPPQRAWINERVCEGCGDCGRKSTCLSVVPVDTELGRKTRIHQSSCTQDMACLEGDCPSFLLVTPGPTPPDRARPALPVTLTDPVAALDPEACVLIRMPGIGGTGVVTVSQVLQMAAVLDGRWSAGLDQTGLAQKGGPVVSDVRLAPAPATGAPRAAGGEVDVLLGLDLLGAVAPETLRTLSPQRTIAVVNVHETATSSMISDTATGFGPLADMVSRIQSATRADRALLLDAGALAEALFADHMPGNVIMLGAAYQHGCVPVSASAIHRALELNGAAVEVNRAAFDWGRAAALDPAAVARALSAGSVTDSAPGSTLDRPPPAAAVRRIDEARPPAELHDLVTRRAADLAGYQDAGYARQYVDDVLAVLAIERERCGSGPGDPAPVTGAYARAMHKLMAYKDEYEVARLHLDAFERARLQAEFGPDAGIQILLHPPLLRSLGMRRKLRLSETAARPLLTGLRASRRLRGTALDPFGRTAIRRLERTLIDEHRAFVRSALSHLTTQTAAEVAELVALADLIRGYEEIKLANVQRYRAACAESMRALARRPSEPALAR